MSRLQLPPKMLLLPRHLRRTRQAKFSLEQTPVPVSPFRVRSACNPVFEAHSQILPPRPFPQNSRLHLQFPSLFQITRCRKAVILPDPTSARARLGGLIRATLHREPVQPSQLSVPRQLILLRTPLKLTGRCLWASQDVSTPLIRLQRAMVLIPVLSSHPHQSQALPLSLPQVLLPPDLSMRVEHTTLSGLLAL